MNPPTYIIGYIWIGLGLQHGLHQIQFNLTVLTQIMKGRGAKLRKVVMLDLGSHEGTSNERT